MILLPCPFCGGKPELRQTGKQKIKIKCTRCLFALEQASFKFSYEWLENEVCSSWNKRIELEKFSEFIINEFYVDEYYSKDEKWAAHELIEKYRMAASVKDQADQRRNPRW